MEGNEHQFYEIKLENYCSEISFFGYRYRYAFFIGIPIGKVQFAYNKIMYKYVGMKMT
jgi:type VI protein secretion system component Hcp